MPRNALSLLSAVALAATVSVAPVLAAPQDQSTSPSETSPATVDVSRLAGADRYGTAAAITGQWSATGQRVYIVSGQEFPDAMVTASRAGVFDAPVLLTKADHLPSETIAALEQLQPESIVVVGGQAAVSDEVVADLATYAGAEGVERVTGSNRYETSAHLAAQYATGPERVFLVSGQDYPDALSAAAAAGAGHEPLLLTTPGELPGVVAEQLQRLAPTEVVVVGGDLAVSDAVATEAAGYTTSGTHRRVAGDNRYQTSAAVAKEFAPGATPGYVASGVDHSDALVVSALAARDEVPVILTPADRVANATREALNHVDPSRIYVAGGPQAVSGAVVEELRGPEAAVPPTWQDEFDGSSVDTSKWNVRDDTYLGYDYAVIDADTVTVQDGVLRIRMEQLPNPIVKSDGRERHWKTGYLDSIGLHTAQYGRWEIRAKIPTKEGTTRGVWPAFWLRNDDVGEIDIMEAWGGPEIRYRNPDLHNTSRFTVHESTNHTGASKGWEYEHQLWPDSAPYDTPDEFHTWAVEYTPDELKAYFDGALAVHLTPTEELVSGQSGDYSWLWGSTFESPWNIRLNMQMGNDYGTPGLEPSDASVMPADYLVDYVRFYEYLP